MLLQKLRHRFALGLLVWLCVGLASSQPARGQQTGYRLEENLPYRTGDGLPADVTDRCRLDVYVPTQTSDFPTVVWFHGGGLTQGS